MIIDYISGLICDDSFSIACIRFRFDNTGVKAMNDDEVFDRFHFISFVKFPFECSLFSGVSTSFNFAFVFTSDGSTVSLGAVFSITYFMGSITGLKYLSNAIFSSILPVFKD